MRIHQILNPIEQPITGHFIRYRVLLLGEKKFNFHCNKATQQFQQ